MSNCVTPPHRASHFLGTGTAIRSPVPCDVVPGQSPVGRVPERSLVGCCDLRICGCVTGVAAVTGVTYGLGWEVSTLPPEPEVTPACHLPRRHLPRPTRAATSGCFRCWSRC